MGAVARHMKTFWADEGGATAIEYAMVAAGIAMAIVAVVNQIGTQLFGTFTAVDAGF